MIYYYIKNMHDPSLRYFMCTPAFEEMQQVFQRMFIMAEQHEIFAMALEEISINYV